MRQTPKYFAVAICLFFVAQTAAEEPMQSDVVPVDKEPRHRVALEDQYVRLFDVRIPAGDTTLYHTHRRDSIYIPISGTAKLTTQEFGKAAKPLSIKPGDVAFVEHSKASFTHRVSNLSTDEFHVIDIELVATPIPSSTLATLPDAHQSVLENARVRVSRIMPEPEQFAVSGANPASSGLIVVLAGSRIGIEKELGAIQSTDVAPGQFYRGSEPTLRFHNEGSDRLEVINIEIK